MPGDRNIAELQALAEEYAGEAVQEPQREALLIPIGELISQPRPLSWAVRRVIERNTLVLLFGAAAEGKSYVALSMAASIASGTDWYGHEVAQAPVVYVAGEGHAGISRRLLAWSQHNDVELASTPLYVSRRAVVFSDAASLKGLVDELDAMEPPGVIFIDTLARASAGMDENSAKDMGQFIQQLDTIRHRYDCTVIIVHHTGLNEKQRARGSSAIKAALDVEIGLSKTDKTIVLKSTKMKDAPPFPDLAFTFKGVELPWLDDYGAPIHSAVLEATDDKPVGSDRPMKGAKRIAYEALRYCLEHDHTEVPQSLKDETWLHPHRVVIEEVWRERCYATGISDGDTPAKSKAFRRARQDLMDSKHIDCREGYYYVK
jgi:hypothetical protein